MTFARTDLLGVYTVTPLADPDASAAPSGGSSPGVVGRCRAPRRRRATALARRAPTFRPPEAGAPTRFAVDLLDVDESRHRARATRRG